MQQSEHEMILDGRNVLLALKQRIRAILSTTRSQNNFSLPVALQANIAFKTVVLYFKIRQSWLVNLEVVQTLTLAL